jgi:endonuclease/exonuclease/phosphatase family metal-dependent hydrolase
MQRSHVAGFLALLVLLGSACDLVPPAPDPNGPRLPQVQLPVAIEGEPYEVILTATGGTPPLSYSVDQVPPGFSFYTKEARLVGPALAAGRYSLSLRVRDAKGATDTRTYDLFVRLPDAGGDAGTGDAGTGDAGTGDAGTGDAGTPDAGTGDAGTPDAGTGDAGTGDAGLSLEFGVGNWNIEWFGDPFNGPSDDLKQLDNVHAVIADAGMDFWGLQELVDGPTFNQLTQRLAGYEGFMANDPFVRLGSSHYTERDQKLGILFRSDLVSVRNAELILTEKSYDFAGRPPLKVDLRFTRGGTSVDLVAIVLHLKAFDTLSDHQRRKNASLALKDYVDTQLPGARVIVLGDWNDDVDESIVKDPYSTDGGYLPTPFMNFLDDPANYTFVTLPLTRAGERSTVKYSNFIDHQLVTNELAADYVSASVRVLKPNIPSYGSTTSDHYPVLSRYQLGRPPPEMPLVFINEFFPHPENSNFDQQFVELFNAGTTTVDLSGWRVDDETSFSGKDPTRHVFANDTLLAPGKALVVYSGGSPDAGNAVVANGGNGLRLNRGKNHNSSGDTVYLHLPDGTRVDSHRYEDTFQGISYNRSPDASPDGTFVLHDTLSGLKASPGQKVNGTSF